MEEHHETTGVRSHNAQTQGVNDAVNTEVNNTSGNGGDSTGVGDVIPEKSPITPGNDNCNDVTPVPSIDNDNNNDTTTTESERIAEAEQAGRDRAISGNDNGRPMRKNRGQFKDNDYAYMLNSSMKKHEDQFSLLIDVITTGDPIKILDSLQNGTMDQTLSLMTEQMTAKKGLKVFGNSGAAAIKKELEQLIYRKVMHGKKSQELTREQKRAALRYLIFLKQKRCGKIKGR